MEISKIIAFVRKIRRAIVGADENVVDYVCGNGDALPLPLGAEEERLAVESMERGEDGERIKKKLIEHNLRLVVYIARKFENTGVDNDDLVSIGTLGLIKAINSFKSEKNIKLATYASRCIENEILMHLRRTVKLKSEVSFEEPLNTDWEGNELMLSDVMGTDGDVVYKKIENGVECDLLKTALKKDGIFLHMLTRHLVCLRYLVPVMLRR